MKHFTGSDEDFVTFWRKLAQECIQNTEDNQATSTGRKTHDSKHVKMKNSQQSVPSYSKIFSGKLKKVYKRKYEQEPCSTIGCKTRTRFYCPCSLDKFRCVQCYSEHIFGKDMDVNSRDGIPL